VGSGKCQAALRDFRPQTSHFKLLPCETKPNLGKFGDMGTRPVSRLGRVQWPAHCAKQSQFVLPERRCARHTLRLPAILRNKAKFQDGFQVGSVRQRSGTSDFKHHTSNSSRAKQSQTWASSEIWAKGQCRVWAGCNGRHIVRNKANLEYPSKTIAKLRLTMPPGRVRAIVWNKAKSGKDGRSGGNPPRGRRFRPRTDRVKQSQLSPAGLRAKQSQWIRRELWSGPEAGLGPCDARRGTIITCRGRADRRKGTAGRLQVRLPERRRLRLRGHARLPRPRRRRHRQDRPERLGPLAIVAGMTLISVTWRCRFFLRGVGRRSPARW
jgi:hypothetical protein